MKLLFSAGITIGMFILLFYFLIPEAVGNEILRLLGCFSFGWFGHKIIIELIGGY